MRYLIVFCFLLLASPSFSSVTRDEKLLFDHVIKKKDLIRDWSLIEYEQTLYLINTLNSSLHAACYNKARKEIYHHANQSSLERLYSKFDLIDTQVPPSSFENKTVYNSITRSLHIKAWSERVLSDLLSFFFTINPQKCLRLPWKSLLTDLSNLYIESDSPDYLQILRIKKECTNLLIDFIEQTCASDLDLWVKSVNSFNSVEDTPLFTQGSTCFEDVKNQILGILYIPFLDENEDLFN
ncbi:hypothetical protein COB21_01430 [Candidatus Aerophobetes bacterium]|uniref:Uncharacterized protein n=1 Tax=Aerophobetes bacterium TaxID=2030807 RepID=A0A2A4X7Y3_UNCAE|nr:MAG: hypothetical protein COB21_01430 [Candidatus Aerophobetes bacterium]